MRVFLGLGHAQLATPRGSHHLAQKVDHRLRREERAEEGIEFRAIARHSSGGGKADPEYPGYQPASRQYGKRPGPGTGRFRRGYIS